MTWLPPIDWATAVRASAQTVRPGPRLSTGQRAELVADLRDVGQRALGWAQEIAQLPPASPVPVRVVGRQGWVAANAAGIGLLLGDAGDEPARPGFRARLQARSIGAQAGLALGLVANRILGQFEPYDEPGTLLLVAPNIWEVERSLGAEPHDFRAWVCVHEQTHRLQFAAAPWLRDELRGLVAEAAAADDGALPGAEQRAVLQRATALMSVLEGYAEVIMDSVGTELIPTVAQLRRGFEARRTRGGWDRVFRRVFGIETKYAQYRDGAAFCRSVLEWAGLATLNRVYAAPEAMPTPAELHDPAAWLARVG